MNHALRLFGLSLLTILGLALLTETAAAQTPQFKLYRAVDRNNYDEALEILKDGVSPNTRTRSDGTPALITAARKGHSRMIKLLLQWKANVDIKDRQSGETALMIRAGAGDLEDLRLLIEYGADVNLTARSRETALTKSVRLRNHRAATLLMEAGANIDVVDVTGNSPLDYALASRDRRMVAILENTKSKVEKKPESAGPGPRPGGF